MNEKLLTQESIYDPAIQMFNRIEEYLINSGKANRFAPPETIGIVIKIAELSRNYFKIWYSPYGDSISYTFNEKKNNKCIIYPFHPEYRIRI